MTTATLLAAFLVVSTNHTADPPPTQASSPTAAKVDACPDRVERPPPRIERIGRLGVGGAAVTLAGLGTFIGGAVVFSRGAVVENPGASLLKITDYRPQGRALMGVGAGAFALGMAAVIVDVALRSKKRRGLAAGPSFAPSMAGVTLSSRF